MTNMHSGGRSLRGPSRRSLIQSSAALLSAPFIAKATTASAQERLAGSGEVVVFSYGGAATEGARRSVFEPFTRATGIRVVDVVADLAEPQVRAMFRAGRVDWDIAFLLGDSYPLMHEAGMLVPIDYSLWDQESLEGTPPAARLEDAVVALRAGMVLAYDERAFPSGGPQNWADFWNVQRFPGPRGLYASLAVFSIQFALLAAGAAHNEIFPLTDDKIDRAFTKLNEIRPHITKWWAAAGEPPLLLINREYAMTSSWDNRVLLQIRQGAPIKIVWDGATMGQSWAAILRGGPNTANAQKLIAFWNRARIAAAWTEATGTPGANTNQLQYLPANLLPLLNITPENASRAIPRDYAWLATRRPDGKTNAEYLQERWLAWRST